MRRTARPSVMVASGYRVLDAPWPGQDAEWIALAYDGLVADRVAEALFAGLLVVADGVLPPLWQLPARLQEAVPPALAVTTATYSAACPLGARIYRLILAPRGTPRAPIEALERRLP